MVALELDERMMRLGVAVDDVLSEVYELEIDVASTGVENLEGFVGEALCFMSFVAAVAGKVGVLRERAVYLLEARGVRVAKEDFDAMVFVRGEGFVAMLSSRRSS